MPPNRTSSLKRGKRKQGHVFDSDSTSDSMSMSMSKRGGTNGKSDTRKQKKIPSVQKKPLWIASSLVVTVVVFLGVLWKLYLSNAVAGSSKNNIVDPAVKVVMDHLVCRHAEGSCPAKNVLEVHDRTHRAKQSIPSTTALFQIPRSLQIWDLDALRYLVSDPNINWKKGLRHKVTGRPLDGGAYLAYYLWRRFEGQQYQQQQQSKESKNSDPLWSYYRVLPTTTSVSNHPMLWSSDEVVKRRLHSHSYAYAAARGYRDMVQSEHQALVKHLRITNDSDSSRTPEFTLQDYQRFRILVLSRSFGTGPPDKQEELLSTNDTGAGVVGTPHFESLSDELVYYNTTFGIDLTLGCRAMVPILDMYNHHAKPNIEWRYDTTKRSFVVVTSTTIEAGQKLFDSYGTYSDAHLFAKFGFVNGDGSGHTQASMAAMHRMMDVGLRQQFSYLPRDRTKLKELVGKSAPKLQLARYLQFDDGHKECVSGTDPTSDTYKLKQFKLQHLMRLAHDAKRWIVTFPPRNPKARRPKANKESVQALAFSRNAPPKFDGSSVLATCRLMVLTPSDCNGDAIRLLKEHLDTQADAIFIPGDSDSQQDDDVDASLEYRAHLCLARWTGINLHRFNIPDGEAVAGYAKKIATTPPMNEFDTAQWAAHHVVLGEVQTLELLNKLAAAGAHQYAQRLRTLSLEQELHLPVIRRIPCDWDDTKRLAEATDYV